MGGILSGGDGHVFVNGETHYGGIAGLALSGNVHLDALVCQGAAPIGPAFEITAVEANLVRGLDGMDVAKALSPVLHQHAKDTGGGGVMMAGISVEGSARSSSAAASAASAPSTHEPGYVVRAVLGYMPDSSAISIAASTDLLHAPGARLQLHSFSASAAREELSARVSALGAAAKARVSDGTGKPLAGGLLAPCLGRGEGLFGEANVESNVLRAALGDELQLCGFFAGGEIGPVGRRTFVHTYTSTLALLS